MNDREKIALIIFAAVAVVAYLQGLEIAKSLRTAGIIPKPPKTITT